MSKGGRGSVKVLAGCEAGEPEDGCAQKMRLLYPRPCGIYEDGAIVFVQRLENRVRVLRGGAVTTLAGGAEGFEDGPSPRFNYPSSGDLDASGRLWLADRDNFRVRRVEATGVTSTIVALPAPMRPCDVAIGRRWTYVTATDCKDGAHCVISICDDAAVPRSSRDHGPQLPRNAEIVAGRLAERGFADGVGENARFWLLYAAAVGPDGRLYLADGNRVRVWDPRTGRVSTIAGKLEAGFRDGGLDQARFFTVRGIAVDADLTIYVSDFGNDRVRVIDMTSRTVSTLAGGADRDKTFEGCGGSASISTPYSLILDDDRGFLYVGTGDDYLVSIAVPSKLARWYLRVAPVLLVFYLLDRGRAYLKPRRAAPPAFLGAANSRAYAALAWLTTTRARSCFLFLILSFYA